MSFFLDAMTTFEELAVTQLLKILLKFYKTRIEFHFTRETLYCFVCRYCNNNDNNNSILIIKVLDLQYKGQLQNYKKINNTQLHNRHTKHTKQSTEIKLVT
jgi:hypothetical protein